MICRERITQAIAGRRQLEFAPIGLSRPVPLGPFQAEILPESRPLVGRPRRAAPLKFRYDLVDDIVNRAREPRGAGAARAGLGVPVTESDPQPCARMEVRSIIAWNIRRIRLSRGMSQRSMALASGLELSYLGSLERGRQNPTVDTLGTLAQSLSAPLLT